MADKFMRPQAITPQTPCTVDSTHSSADNNSQLIFSPDQGSTIINNGNTFMAETLRSYIEALKFEDAVNQQESSVLVAEFLGRKKVSNAKEDKSGSVNSKAKSKVTFSSPSGYLDPRSQQQLGAKGKGDKKSKSSTSTVIRDWGKQPLLVESEAPWTPRNRMYQNAIKAVARARQLTSNPVTGANLGPYQYQQVSMGKGPPPSFMAYDERNGNPAPMFLPANSVPQVLPFLPVPQSAIVQQQPIVTGISPMPVDFNNSPLTLAVAIEPSTGYPYQSMAPPSSQPVVYGQLNSQGLWVPVIEQTTLQRRQPQP